MCICCVLNHARQSTPKTLALAVILVALSSGQRTALGQGALVQQPHPAVCRIMVPEKDGISFGSGTLVAVQDKYGLVVTNWHVVQNSTQAVNVVFPNGFRSGARVLKTDRDWDLAALLIWRPDSSPVSIAMQPPKQGDVLTIAGYGPGQYRTATGRVTQYVSPGSNMPFEMVELSAQARQGDSGGPIFNQQGELAGVLFGASQGATAGSYAGRVNWFLASLSQQVEQQTESMLASAPISRPVDVVKAPQIQKENDQLVSVQPSPQATQSALAPTETKPVSISKSGKSSISLRDIIGESPLDWGKSALAAIGVLAILVQVMRRLE